MDDQVIMKRVIRLAKKGTGRVSPNPRVGAIIVKNHKIISEGYHRDYGGPHAEINAISRFPSEILKDSTLYINLEPCSHRGQTPPCTQAIIKSGIQKVIVGHIDPNPLVNGKGIALLRKAGLQVKLGVLKNDCYLLNETYIKWITKNRPFVTLKIAQTLDGKIATTTGKSHWITSKRSRQIVHRMRSEHDAILVGINTILIDNPELTVRLVKNYPHQPKRFVLDELLRISLESRILKHPDIERTIIVTSEHSPKDRIQKLTDKGATIWKINTDSEGKLSIQHLCKRMAQEKISSLLVEGGRQIFTSFYNSGETDQIILFIAPKLFGSGYESFSDLRIKSPQDGDIFKSAKWRRVGNDMIFEGRL